MSYRSRIKSLVSLNGAILLRHVAATHVIAVQQNLNLFEFFIQNGVVSLVPRGQSSHSNSSL